MENMKSVWNKSNETTKFKSNYIELVSSTVRPKSYVKLVTSELQVGVSVASSCNIAIQKWDGTCVLVESLYFIYIPAHPRGLVGALGIIWRTGIRRQPNYRKAIPFRAGINENNLVYIQIIYVCIVLDFFPRLL